MEHDTSGPDTVRVARLLAPVATLGPGRRLGLWVQGCGLACTGCASRDTWDPAAGTIVPVQDLAHRLAELVTTEQLTGITLTGGEPTDQADALASALVKATDILGWSPDILLFTGRTAEAAERLAAPLLTLADCVVAGPYQPGHPAPIGLTRLVASGNQSVRYRDADTKQRYESWLRSAGPELQVLADAQDLYIVGLPRAGDLDRFRTGLRRRGVLLEGATWTA